MYCYGDDTYTYCYGTEDCHWCIEEDYVNDTLIFSSNCYGYECSGWYEEDLYCYGCFDTEYGGGYAYCYGEGADFYCYGTEDCYYCYDYMEYDGFWYCY